jgi:hypothetical protein
MATGKLITPLLKCVIERPPPEGKLDGGLIHRVEFGESI